MWIYLFSIGMAIVIFGDQMGLMKKNFFIASAAIAATGLTMYFAKKRSSDTEDHKHKFNKKQMTHLYPSVLRSNAYLYDLAIYDDRPE